MGPMPSGWATKGVRSDSSVPHSAHFRMVTSYWDMAASFVLNGAVDEKMFNDATGEQVVVFAKIEPFLADYRAKMGNPAALRSLETLVMKREGIAATLAVVDVRIVTPSSRSIFSR